MYENSQSKPQAKITNLFLDFDEVTNLGSFCGDVLNRTEPDNCHLNGHLVMYELLWTFMI